MRVPGGLLVIVVTSVVLAGCATGSSASPSATAFVPPSPAPGTGSVLSAVPSQTEEASPSTEPNGGGLPPPRIVTPKPGQLDVHPIAAEQLAATVTGRNVAVEITYASGVEPCYVLDSIVVERGDHAFTITLRQGHGPGDAVCIQLAEIVRSFVDLGELQPGTYTISDSQKGAQPISVTVA
jgi:hypothetical protein